MTFSTRSARVAGAGALAFALLGLSACASTESDADTSDTGSGDGPTVSMSIQPWLGYGPWYIAQEKGYFEDAGVDVEITNFMNDADTVAAFSSGRVQVASSASHSALQMIEQGLDVSIVLLLDASLTADAILTDGSITDIADLKGQRVAFEEGSVSNLLLGYALQQNGLTLDDIEPVPMDPAKAATALMGGSVPVAVTYEPYISEARGSGEDFELLYTAAENEGLISDVLIVDNTFLTENPEAVQDIVDAWGPAIDFYESDTDEAQTIIAEAIGSDVKALKTAFEGVEYFSLEDNKTTLSGDYLQNVLPSVQDVATQIGLLEGGADLDAIVDPTFVDSAE